MPQSIKLGPRLHSGTMRLEFAYHISKLGKQRGNLVPQKYRLRIEENIQSFEADF